MRESYISIPLRYRVIQLHAVGTLAFEHVVFEKLASENVNPRVRTGRAREDEKRREYSGNVGRSRHKFRGKRHSWIVGQYRHGPKTVL